MPKISVISPIYNIQNAYLEKCIFSLCKQTLEDIEILLVDDGSEAYVEEICLKYAKEDKRIQYIRIEHQGVSIARNTGLEKATGEYIAFVDPDDFVELNYLEHLYETSKEWQVDVLLCDCFISTTKQDQPNAFYTGKARILESQEKEQLMYQLVNKKICGYYPPHIACGVPWAKLFKRSFIEEKQLRFVPGLVRMQDNVFCFYAFQEANTIGYLPEYLYHYRIDEESVSHRYNEQIVSYFEHYYQELDTFINKYQKEPLLKQALQMKELTSFNAYLTNYYFHPANTKTWKQITNELNALLEKEPYCSALQAIDTKLLNNQERIFVSCLKNRRWKLLRLLVKARNHV